MRKLFPLPIHLLLVFTNLILVLVAVSCVTGVPSPTLGGSPIAVSSVATKTTEVAPTSSVLAHPTFTSGETAIPFQTLAQGFRLGSAESEPALLLVAEAESRDAMVSLIDPKHQTLLKGVDLERDLVLGAFWGAKPSGGFSITVAKIFVTNAELTVNVILGENDPTAPRIDAATSPYHLVTVNRLTLPQDTVLHYRLVSDEGLLAEGELP